MRQTNFAIIRNQLFWAFHYSKTRYDWPMNHVANEWRGLFIAFQCVHFREFITWCYSTCSIEKETSPVWKFSFAKGKVISFLKSDSLRKDYSLVRLIVILTIISVNIEIRIFSSCTKCLACKISEIHRQPRQFRGEKILFILFIQCMILPS